MPAARRRTCPQAPGRSVPRSSAASSSVSVRSGEPNATRKASDRLPAPDLLAAVLVEDRRRRAAPGRPPRAAPRAAPPRARPRRRRTRGPAAPPGTGSPPRTRPPRGAAATSASRSSSNAPHVPSRSDGCSSPTQPSFVRADFPGMEVRLRGALVLRLDLQRVVELLDRPLRVGEPAVDDARDVPALVGKLAAGAVRPRDLEQRNLGGADRDVVTRCARRGSRSAPCAGRLPPGRAAREVARRLRRRTSTCTPRRSRSPSARPRRVAAGAASASAGRTSRRARAA